MHKNLTYFLYITSPNPNPTGPSTPQYENYPEWFFQLTYRLQRSTLFVREASKLQSPQWNSNQRYQSSTPTNWETKLIQAMAKENQKHICKPRPLHNVAFNSRGSNSTSQIVSFEKHHEKFPYWGVLLFNRAN